MMTDEEVKFQTVKLELSVNFWEESTFNIQDKKQLVVFSYDRNCKGTQTEMQLISLNGDAIHAPNCRIIFDNETLKKVLQFVIKSEEKESDAIVPERDTFDRTLGKCTGKCNIIGVGLSQCSECGWDETHSLK